MKLDLSQTSFLFGLLTLFLRHTWAEGKKYGYDERNLPGDVESESHERVLNDMSDISELFQIDFSALNRTLSSDLHLEIGIGEISEERVSEIWKMMAVDTFKRCNDKEQNVTFSDRLEALCPYLVCISNAEEDISEYDPVNSGFGRKNFLLNIMRNVSGKWGSGLDETDVDTVYNSDDETCFSVSVYASAILFLNEAAKNDDSINVLLIPISRNLKIQTGVIQDILRAALENIEDDDSRRKLEFNNETETNTDPVPEVVQANHTLHGNSTLQVTLCNSFTSSTIGTVISSINNLMSDKSPDGSQSLIKYLFGIEENQWDDIQDKTKFPERARFWEQVFTEGIDSDEGCSALVDNLTFTPVFGNSPITNTLVIGFNEDANEDDITVPCVLSLLMAIALTPQICSVSLTPQFETLQQEYQPTSGERNLNVNAGTRTQGSQKNRAVFWDSGLTGKGQVVAVSDSGLDVDNCYFRNMNNQDIKKNGKIDMSQRKVVQYIDFADDSDRYEGHGTHVCGTIAGSRMVNGKEMDGFATGIARDARIAFMDVGDSIGRLYIPRDMEYLLETGKEAGAKLHSASWGAKALSYTKMTRDVDDYIYKNQDFLLIVAAGNSGSGGKAQTIMSPAQAKNALTVGATDSQDLTKLADFSSRGPTPFGATKPDVVAPGDSILSANANPYKIGECDGAIKPSVFVKTGDGVTWKRGTSMATPLTSGAAAIIRQYFVEGFFQNGAQGTKSHNPSGVLIKAVIMNGGQVVDYTDKRVFFSKRSEMYDQSTNMGRISLIDSLPLAGKNNFNLKFEDGARLEVKKQDTYKIRINHSSSCDSKELRITVAWADPPGFVGCRNCLRNDLDLFVVDMSTRKYFYPNGKFGRDRYNNVERVILSDLRNGEEFSINVYARNLDTRDQKYSIVMTGCFDFTDKFVDKIPTDDPPKSESSSVMHMVSFSRFFVTLGLYFVLAW